MADSNIPGPSRDGSPVQVTAKGGDLKPQNALQSDFNANDTASMDSDERYLV